MKFLKGLLVGIIAGAMVAIAICYAIGFNGKKADEVGPMQSAFVKAASKRFYAAAEARGISLNRGYRTDFEESLAAAWKCNRLALLKGEGLADDELALTVMRTVFGGTATE